MVEARTDRWFNFQPSQIVYLEHEGYRLYGEVVQVVEARHVCWVRPLGMTANAAIDQSEQNSFNSSTQPEAAISWIDLRQGSDLLLPVSLFQPALDVDILPLLNYLYADNSTSNQGKSGATYHQQLNWFIRKLWIAFPESFRNDS